MDGEPDAGRLGTGGCHPVATVGRQKQVISALEVSLASIAVDECGVTLKQHHPFISILVIPSTVGGGVSPGDDALDRGVWGVLNRLDVFAIGTRMRQIKQIWHGQNSDVALAWRFEACKHNPGLNVSKY